MNSIDFFLSALLLLFLSIDHHTNKQRIHVCLHLFVVAPLSVWLCFSSQQSFQSLRCHNDTSIINNTQEFTDVPSIKQQERRNETRTDRHETTTLQQQQIALTDYKHSTQCSLKFARQACAGDKKKKRNTTKRTVESNKQPSNVLCESQICSDNKYLVKRILWI